MATSASASSGSSIHAPHAHGHPKGILRSSGSRKRRSLVWDEGNLDSNEIERIERGPRMKINEPKTPFQHSLTMRSPNPLNLDDSADTGSGRHSPTSAIDTAGTLPSDLSLGGRLDQISNEALSRREREWEDDSDDELTDEPATAERRGHPSKRHSLSFSDSNLVAPAASSPAARPHIETSSDGTSSGPDTPEKKHERFELERKKNYQNMVSDVAACSSFDHAALWGPHVRAETLLARADPCLSCQLV